MMKKIKKVRFFLILVFIIFALVLVINKSNRMINVAENKKIDLSNERRSF